LSKQRALIQAEFDKEQYLVAVIEQ